MNSKLLFKTGFKPGKAFGMILTYFDTLPEDSDENSLIELLKDLNENPGNYTDHPELSGIAYELMRPIISEEMITLNEEAPNYNCFGEEHIEDGAKLQMKTAMKLPVTVAGALMPDAHQGYGLPIGGVLATRNAIIPYGVGVDIGCRMALSILDLPASMIETHHAKLKRELIAQTLFGAGRFFKKEELKDHEILYRPEFGINRFISSLREKATYQLGSSGGGNHFVEFGVIEFSQRNEQMNIDEGQYLAVLSHSGSRGLGATIAGEYTRIAKSLCRLPAEAANLAYLDINQEAGAEYWALMNLAGDYASACHEVIHDKIVKALNAQVLARVENHHNFAWKEIHNGEELIVHRKGATPASENTLGFIPGSMATAGYLVSGKGHSESLNSASHGAGRSMSRTKAEKEIKKDDMRSILKDKGITLIGGGLDEAPQAYKDIEKVMASQLDLVNVIAKFSPKIVRMADDGSRED